MNDINKICIMTQGKENDHRKEELYQLTFDENDRVSFNALWALGHFDEANTPWLFQKHDDLIDLRHVHTLEKYVYGNDVVHGIFGFFSCTKSLLTTPSFPLIIRLT